MYKPATGILTCPNCMSTHPIKSADDLTRLIKNFTLLSLVEAAKSTPTPAGSSHSRLHKSKTNLSNLASGSIQNDLNELEECKSEEEDNLGGDHLEVLDRSRRKKSESASLEEAKRNQPPKISYN